MPTGYTKKINIDTDEAWLLVSLVADNEATEEQRLEFEALLAHNPGLQDHLTMIRCVGSVATMMTEQQPAEPPFLTQSIQSKLREYAASEEVNIDDRWELLSRYADGEAAPHERLLVESKLDADNSWRDELHMIQAAGMALRSMSVPDAPAHLAASITTALHRKEAGSFSLRKLGEYAAFARTFTAGAAAAALFGFVALRATETSVHTVSSNLGEPKIARIEAPPALLLGAPDTLALETGHGIRNAPPANKALSVNSSRLALAVALRSANPGSTRRFVGTAVRGTERSKFQSTGISTGLLTKDAGAGSVVDANQPEANDAVPAVTFAPGMDRQNQRPPVILASAQGGLADQGDNNAPSGDTDTLRPVAANNPGSLTAGGTPANETARVHPLSQTHTIVAHLTALPPDANQVLTRADMARNHAALNSGYDKLSLRNLERKEASVFLLRGSF